MTNIAIKNDFLRWIGESEDTGWNEYFSEQVAKGILPKFSPAEWAWLNSHINGQQDYWIQRCIAALGDSRLPEAIPLLKNQLNSPNFDTQIMAASELDWQDIPIESQYTEVIARILSRIPIEDHHLYPEILSLLQKSKQATT